MINYSVENNGAEVLTKVMVKLELNLPWKPVLAWPWGVKYLIDPDTYLVTDHIESCSLVRLFQNLTSSKKDFFRKASSSVIFPTVIGNAKIDKAKLCCFTAKIKHFSLAVLLRFVTTL